MSSRKSGRLLVQLLSDLHGEIIPASLPDHRSIDAGADIVLLPGDLADAANSVSWAASAFPEAIIAIVPGNHELWNMQCGVDDCVDVMRKAARAETARSGRSVVVLDDEAATVEVRGVQVRFLGCTLWTDFGLSGNPVLGAVQAVGGINDFRFIDGGRFTTGEWIARFEASRRFLRRELMVDHDGPTVVLTHHLPSRRSMNLRWQWRDDPISPAFASNLDDLVGAGATLWVHGHTHDSCVWRDDGGTLVACNPAGKPMGRDGGFIRQNPAFNPAMLIDMRIGAPDGLWHAGVVRSTAHSKD